VQHRFVLNKKVISSLVKEISLSERPGCAAAAVLVDDRQARGGWGIEHCLQRAILQSSIENVVVDM
jgi:hypothetical protein